VNSIDFVLTAITNSIVAVFDDIIFSCLGMWKGKKQTDHWCLEVILMEVVSRPRSAVKLKKCSPFAYEMRHVAGEAN
jgi:hypothetical protein